MNIAYFDCVGGASGDMLLGALADATDCQDAIRAAVSGLKLPECDLSFDRVTRGGLSALKATVHVSHHIGSRKLPDLIEVIRNADLDDPIKLQAEKILLRLGESESAIHDTSLEDLHLHELGGDDTLVDIVGVLAALDVSAIDSVFVSSLPIARGWTESSHGTIPLPAPATLNLLKGVPVKYVDLDVELVTPTGAVLLTVLASRFGGFPPMTLRNVGSGAGSRELPFPNLVRVWLGDSEDVQDNIIVENLMVLETNIDDMNPQLYEHVMDEIFVAGALDVSLIPQQMKKNRPGIMLSVLCPPDKANTIMSVIFSQTTTLGVRRHAVDRLSVPRVIEEVETPFGRVKVKMAQWGNQTRVTPEYADCRRAAQSFSVPLKDVLLAALDAARSK